MTNKLVHISANLLYDSHFVQGCFKDSLNYLENQGKSFGKIIQYRDVCSAQINKKKTFIDLSCAEKDL